MGAEQSLSVLMVAAESNLVLALNERLSAEGYDCVVLRRGATEVPRANVYASRTLEADFRTARVTRDGTPVALTALELHLLQYLVEHRGEVLSREELLEKVWGYGAMPVTRTIDVRIASLRRKLERDPSRPELIVTVHGAGYRFVDDAD
jgi:DNA-binding response OmpR family regulator